MPKIKKPHLKQSPIKSFLSESKTREQLKKEETFKISLKHLDRTQGDNSEQWDSSHMLCEAFETLRNYSHRALREQIDGDKFAIYGSFPKRSAFKHPSNVPEDARWARIHVNGLHVLAGHVVDDTFYLVFLDSKHQFYIMAD